MKQLFLIIAIFSLYNQLSSQEIKFLATYSTSDYNKFNNNVGYGVGYNKFIKSKNKLGFTFSHSFNYTDYNYIFISDADGTDYYRDVKFKNQRISFSINYSFNIFNKHKSNFYFGPELGFNYFKVDERGIEIDLNDNSYDNDYILAYWDFNKVGIGFLFEYERHIISDKISLSFSTVPELVFFSRFGLDGYSGPVITGLLNFSLSVKYNLTKD